jgi:hypothetical protein
MELIVMDADGEDEQGSIEVTATDHASLLAALEAADYIESSASCHVQHGPEGSFYITDEDGERLWVLEDPLNLEDEEGDEDEEDEEDEDE